MDIGKIETGENHNDGESVPTSVGVELNISNPIPEAKRNVSSQEQNETCNILKNSLIESNEDDQINWESALNSCTLVGADNARLFYHESSDKNKMIIRQMFRYYPDKIEVINDDNQVSYTCFGMIPAAPEDWSIFFVDPVDLSTMTFWQKIKEKVSGNRYENCPLQPSMINLLNLADNGPITSGSVDDWLKIFKKCTKLSKISENDQESVPGMQVARHLLCLSGSIWTNSKPSAASTPVFVFSENACYYLDLDNPMHGLIRPRKNGVVALKVGEGIVS